MLEFAELLTVDPGNMKAEYVQGLRDLGWTDADVIDIVHIVALYNYMVRVADGLGVELESGDRWESMADKLPFRGEVAHRPFGRHVSGPG